MVDIMLKFLYLFSLFGFVFINVLHTLKNLCSVPRLLVLSRGYIRWWLASWWL